VKCPSIHRGGFTLVELSIVLVIIGLLVGGVLVGRDLITAAEMRRIISDKDKFTAAINVFRTKYICQPGDCVNATQFFAGTGNGNGNGLIDPGDNGDCNGGQYCYMAGQQTAAGGHDEVSLLNEHLAKAKLIRLPVFNSLTDTIPEEMDGLWYVNLGRPNLNLIPLTLDGTNLIRLAARQFDPGYFRVQIMDVNPSLDPVEAFSIDAKIDDGLPLSGNIVNERALNGAGQDRHGCQKDEWGNEYDVGHISNPAVPWSLPCMLTIYNAF
jgi:prepilin-type N-terminal cleavage/methylation domain-containing protein